MVNKQVDTSLCDASKVTSSRSGSDYFNLVSTGPVSLNEQSLWGDAVVKLAMCCSPAIFILIGVKMKLSIAEHMGLLFLMVMRTGCALLFVAAYASLRGPESNEILFWVYFSNAALSFWPYTHIVKLSNAEECIHKGLREAAFMEAAECVYLKDDTRHWFDEQYSEILKGSAISRALVADAVEKLRDDKAWVWPSVDYNRASGQQREATIAKLRKMFAILASCEGTFDMAIALVSITVSFSWTVLFCTVVSLTPVEFWADPKTCPIAGGILTLVGLSYLGLHGHRLRREEIVGGRCSIVAEARVDELTLVEADEELKRQLEREVIFRASIVGQQDALRTHARRSIMSSMCGSVDIHSSLDGLKDSLRSDTPHQRVSLRSSPRTSFILASRSSGCGSSSLPVLMGRESTLQPSSRPCFEPCKQPRAVLVDKECAPVDPVF